MAPDSPGQPSRRSSVFAPVDQDDMIARLDSVAEDDLTSTFFADSMLEVESAATDAFDLGISAVTRDGSADESSTELLGTSGSRSSGVRPSGKLADDSARQRSFILGGPQGLG